MSEFEWIARYFAPLASEAGLGLSDDAALYRPMAGQELVITTDAAIAGVHFFADDAPSSIAQKILRVNLSDLAAKGARPVGYLLSLMLPQDTKEDWIAEFAAGLASDQERYGTRLFGGDTCHTQGETCVSITAIGEVTQGKMLRRRGAQLGDTLYLTGTLGDAAFGLKARQGKWEKNEYLLDRYLHPRPRLDVGQALAEIATACMDVSDGLVQDAEHLARASGVALAINIAQLTFSREVRDILAQHPDWLELALTGGDDYELLFTAPLEAREAIDELSLRSGVAITPIGTVIGGEGVSVMDAKGEPFELKHKGWQHF